MHARGSAADGFFECTKAIPEFTRASLFGEAGKETPVFVRFSTVLGERGSTDRARDVRGFAVKFDTDEGNWDLVGNNIPASGAFIAAIARHRHFARETDPPRI